MLKEIRILQFLPACPYVLELQEVYESEDVLVLVFPFMPGRDLYRRIRESQKITEKQAFAFFLQITKGLLFLHRHGVCHRDIKPDNILFLDEHRLKIADFSLADVFHERMQGVCGTPGYMGPEIFERGVYSEKIDVYSLGVVLYTMFSIFSRDSYSLLKADWRLALPGQGSHRGHREEQERGAEPAIQDLPEALSPRYLILNQFSRFPLPLQIFKISRVSRKTSPSNPFLLSHDISY